MKTTLKKYDYEQAKLLLEHLDRRIDTAPAGAKPVFPGIVWLHDLVHRLSNEHRSA